MSVELRLVADPDRIYAALARVPSSIGPFGALRRPFLIALIIGTTTALLSTRHVTPSLVLSTSVAWSVVVLFQIALALSVIAGRAARSVGLARALDLFFASHAPWSLWMLAVAAWQPSSTDKTVLPVLVSMSLPVVLTPRMIAAFFRQVLAMDRREAFRRTAIHQTVTWITSLGLFAAAVALPPRIIEWLR